MIFVNSFLFFLATSAHLVAGALEPSFDWSTITPSTKLKYHPCFKPFQCARLLLPLDWLHENTTDTVSIAIIKLPAAVPEDDPAFGGAIFTNPGGPGSSGTQMLLNAGSLLKRIIDIPGKKHYEYISFDPRGVGASEPRINCYPANSMARSAKVMEVLAGGALSLSPASLTFQHYSARAFSKRCEKTNAKILPFVNTPSVARDMVAMVDKIAELRQEQAAQQQNTDTQSQLRKTKEAVPRLQYIGFSYGTVLGSYFASLFPERVSRMVLDGVVDSHDYANGPGWLANTQDADEMMGIFFEGCFNAGSKVCQLRQPSDKTPSDISKRTWSWINALDEEPLQATSVDGSTDVLLRASDIRDYLFFSLYHADFTFFRVAGILAQALEGHPGWLVNVILESYKVSSLTNECSVGNNTMAAESVSVVEARDAVMCTDGDDVSGHNSTYWKSYMDKQLLISPLFGDLWATVRLDCSAWRVRPNWSFKGPFTTPAPSKDPSAPEPGHPAAPLLFLSNKWDPVTPLRNARSMASRYPGAGILVSNAMGHGVLAVGGVNECTKKVVSEYFDKGIVPKKEVGCEGGKDPWVNTFSQHGGVQESVRRRSRYNLLGV